MGKPLKMVTWKIEEMGE